MAQQTLNRGTSANDGTGDTLRVAAQKINENFTELYTTVGGDSSTVTLTQLGVVFEGQAADDHETTLCAIEPTADNIVYVPNDGGTLILDSCQQTLTNKTILSPVLTTPSIKDADSSHSYNFVVSNLAANRNITLPLLTGHDTFLFANHPQTLTNKTIEDPVLSNPIIGGIDGGSLLLDSASNEYIKFTNVSSAVNHVQIGNSASGNNPTVDVEGADTNISLELRAKGSGAVEVMNKLVFQKGTDVSATEAIDLNEPLTVFNSGSLISPTIGDGTIQGEVKYFSNIAAGEARLTTGSTSNIYGVANNGHVSFGQGDGCILVWNSSASKWFFVSNNGTTIGTA